MKKTLLLALWILGAPVFVISAYAQLPLTAADASKISPILDNRPSNTLDCWVVPTKPTLDFVFRFVAGYTVHCPLAQFDGRKTSVVIYLRVTPEKSAAMILGLAHDIPDVPREIQNPAANNFGSKDRDVVLSGAFGLGQGKYSVELLLRDDRNRTYRKRWKLHARIGGSDRGVAMAIKPGTVESVDDPKWQTVSSERGGKLRLTILLDAAPLDPDQTTLHAWDRALLLEMIYTVLRRIPHQSARLVAFSLDQQKELFRSDPFDDGAFKALSDTLQGAEFSSISVEALKKKTSTEFLGGLTNHEFAAQKSDAIIFLGPNTEMDLHIPAGTVPGGASPGPRVFYVEYFWWVGEQFPDEISRLVRAAGGKVFPVHTPAQLDEAIDKMLRTLKQE